jgi:hypothetical protein
MCYNASMSYTLGALGLGTAGYLAAVRPKLKYQYVMMVLLFYTSMELLQGVQYGFVNQCSSRVNRILTEVAYVLVIVQPLMWNLFFYLNSSSCDQRVFQVGMVLSLLWLAFNLSARILHGRVGPRQTKDMSAFAGKQVCTRRKTSHLYWEWTSANFMDFTATYLWYLLLWFIPPLLVAKHRVSAYVMAVFAGLGSAMAYISGEPYIFASAWCYISVPMILTMVVFQQRFT